jgi:hypothetical protein
MSRDFATHRGIEGNRRRRRKKEPPIYADMLDTRKTTLADFVSAFIRLRTASADEAGAYRLFFFICGPRHAVYSA